MLSYFIKRSAFIGALLYLVFLFKTSESFQPLYFYHIVVFLSYVWILYYHLNQRNKNFYSGSRLSYTVFFVSFIFVALNNFTSLIYNNNMFVFSEADALSYHFVSIRMADLPFFDALEYVLSILSFEDIGAPLVISTLYRVVESNITLNFFYVITNVFAAKAIYRINLNFMTPKYAFVCALSYSLSSFVLWFHSSGLKESFLCFLVILFFDRYYLYLKRKHISEVVYASIFISGLLLFRPALIFFGIASVSMGIFLQKRKGTTSAVVIFLAFIAVVGSSSLIESTYDKFLMGGDLERLVLAKESMVKVSLPFTIIVNFIAQVIGPLPTISPDTKEILSFFSPGLIGKVLLSFIFWIGVYHIIKFKAEKLYPLVFFALMEMASLLIILEGLELRKSLPHFFCIYTVSFWFMDRYDLTKFFTKRRQFKLALKFSAALTFCMILVWNFR